MAQQTEENVVTAVYMKKSVKKTAKLYALKKQTSLSKLVEKGLMAIIPAYQNKATA